VLPELEGGVLVLAVKAGLDMKQPERLNEFILPGGALDTWQTAFATHFEFLNLLDDLVDWG